MTVSAGVTLTANLESILGGTAEAGFLRITLCGFGPVLPSVPGVAMLADAGVPQLIGPQVGSTPISQKLWGNDVITPAITFYEIAVLDQNKEVIQVGAYQFGNADGTVDLSSVAQFTGPYGFQLADLTYQPCTGTIGGNTFVSPGRIVAVTYNGVIMPESAGPFPLLSYTIGADGVTITLNFNTQAGDRIDAFCVL